MNNKSRWHLVISSLLYPAFLGNMLYLAIEEGSELPPRAAFSLTGLLVAILLIHYILDYVYTVINEERTDYDPFTFACDVLIVVFLYLGVKAAVAAHIEANGPDMFAPADVLFLPALWLALEKTVAVVWELRRAYKDTEHLKNCPTRLAVFALTTDSAIAIFCFVAYFARPFIPFWLFVIAVLVDACLYYLHEIVKQKWSKDVMKRC